MPQRGGGGKWASEPVKIAAQAPVVAGDDFLERADAVLETGDLVITGIGLIAAQITAALTIMQSYAAGEIGPEGAVALLTAAGVPADAAQNMVDKQQVKE